MDSIVLETSSGAGEGSRTLAYLLAMLLILGGIAAAIHSGTLQPSLWVVPGVLIYVWLFRTQPQIVYQPYLVLDETGIRYQHSFGPRGRSCHYRWPDIAEPEILLASKGHEQQGLQFKWKKARVYSVPILLGISSESDCLKIFAAVNHALAHGNETTSLERLTALPLRAPTRIDT